jgi:hypothetical protein
MGMHNKNGRYNADEAAYIKSTSQRNDEAFSLFLARELTYIRTRVLEVAKAPMNAFRVFPVQTEVPAGAQIAIQRIYDQTGIAKVISNYADDLPRADVVGKEIPTKVVTIGDSYGYNVIEIENAQFAGVNLEMRKAQAARRAVDLKINKTAWFGDEDNGIIGFLNNPNLTAVTVPADGNQNGGVNSTKFIHKTPDQIIRDINNAISAINIATNNVENPNTVLFPTEAFDHIVMTPRSNISDLTILEFLRRSHPDVRFEKVGELDHAGTNGDGLMVVGRFDPDVIRLEIPERFRQLPVEKRNLEYVVDCICRYVGVTITIPMAFSKASGV